MRVFVATLAICALGSAGLTRAHPSLARPAAQDAQQTQSFSIPDTRATRALADSVQGHIAARRWSDAIRALQQMLEDHRGDVLAPERPKSAAGRPSEQPVHAGAAQRARAGLWSLPLEARRLYRERHEAEALAAFERARERGDRRALTEVARRWPLTDSAERAWWSLGDLELELGNPREALAAWGRAVANALAVHDVALDTLAEWEDARARLLARTPPPPPGVDSRVVFALHLLSASDGGITPQSGTRVDGADARSQRPSPPGRDADAWPSAFSLPEHPFKKAGSLLPARSGDTLLVSTSLRLLALNAYSGALLWDSGEADGWEPLDDQRRVELWEGVDEENGLVAPAASEHVAVCALHIPMSVPPRQDRTFQNIKILTPIPERRLFAFDLDTGRELWNHHPPPMWDGESGGFTDRMSVAGPPVIAGTRVLVPFRRMQGRIDFHVGCIDVDTGAVLWSTDLISGQRELNMFGRPVKEFSAPPLVVAGDRVIALTQLGAIAALDLFTGEILWETVYEQIPLPKAQDFSAPRREQCWKNGPPMVTEGTIIAAPVDSRDLIGVDLETGGLLWSLSKSTIDGFMRGRGEANRYALLGARDDVVYVSGNQILALESRGGLHQGAPITVKWSFEDDGFHLREPVRGVLAGDRIVAPTSSERIEIELSQGLKIADWPWAEDESGASLMIGPGELFTLSSSRVNGYFEWDVLVDRARRERDKKPSDPRLALVLGELLGSRGTAQWQKGKTESARAVLAEAREVLERGLANDPAALGAPLSAALHSVLRSEARVRESLADGPGALQALRQARASAPDGAALRDTLLEEVALLEARSPEAALEALAVLEQSCAELPLVCTITPLPNTDGESGVTGEVRLPRFVPAQVAALDNGDARCQLPVGLWVLFERAALARDAADSAAEFAALHALLERYADVDLAGGTAGEMAAERIGSMLRAGRTSGYEVFESRAKAELEAALASRDRQKLSDVARDYPHSRASQTANDALLEWAIEGLEVERVARIVRSELAADWSPSAATPRDVQLCLRLAAVLGAVGNREAANELVRTLAESHPDVASEIAAHRGKKLVELASGIARWTPPDSLPPVGRFDAGVRAVELDSSWDAEHEILGVLPGPIEERRAGAERPLLLVRSASGPQTATFVAVSPRDATKVLWTAAIRMANLPSSSTPGGYARRAALSSTRVCVATGESIVGLDAESGTPAWEWRPSSTPRSTSIAVSSGVLIAVLRLPDERYVLQALDAQGGHELWREELADTSLLRIPVLASNRLVFLPALGRAMCATYDLFTGRRGITFKLDPPAGSNMERDSWVEGDRLILPWLNATRANLSSSNLVQAIDLASGRRLWKVEFAEQDASEPRTLDGVLQFGERTFLVVRPWRGAEDKATSPGMILELATQIGATAPISNVRVMPEDRIFGLASSSRVRLQSSLVFILAERRDAETSSLRCVDLTSGELWIQSLSVPASELEYNLPMPLPAISETTVAVGFTRRPRDRQNPPTTLLFYDRATGVKRDERTLSLPLLRSDRAQFVAFGDALIVRGGRQLEILR